MRVFVFATVTGILIGFLCLRLAEEVNNSASPFQLATPPTGLADSDQYRVEELAADVPVPPPLSEKQFIEMADGTTVNVEYIDISGLRPVRVISRGQRVEVRRFLNRSGRTIVMFTASWCPGCQVLQPKLEALARKAPDLALRLVDINTWGSPVAQQYNIRGIPHLMLFRGQQLVAEGRENVLQAIGLID
jgi:thiol-disulfide isomerase/thioredoxin